jgi:hypothetical protein
MADDVIIKSKGAGRGDNTDQRVLGRLEQGFETLTSAVETMSANLDGVQEQLVKQQLAFGTLPCGERKREISALTKTVERKVGAIDRKVCAVQKSVDSLKGTAVAVKASWRTLVVVGSVTLGVASLVFGLISILRNGG